MKIDGLQIGIESSVSVIFILALKTDESLIDGRSPSGRFSPLVWKPNNLEEPATALSVAYTT